ncbi:apelin receptor [Acrasis kona]|uniref:Apelin receptor n=1 Tax=Acrasis kona TaxID=1008807 RepID=A0AAW2Z879_9EUKA
MSGLVNLVVEKAKKIHHWIDDYPKVKTDTVFDTFWVRSLLGVLLCFISFPLLIIPFIIYTLYEYYYGEKGIKNKKNIKKEQEGKPKEE